MAEKSGFFNSVNGDRKYKADFFAEYFASFIGNGVFPNPSTNLQLISSGSMDMTLKAGKAWINGYYYNNDADKILNIENADGVLNRIDRVVLQFNTLNRTITVKIKKGSFATTPAAPALQRDANAYELGLADIYIGKGTINITQTNITDLRLDSTKCGVVRGTIEQIDTTTLFNQYQTWLNEKKTLYDTDMVNWTGQKKAEYDAWVSAANSTNQTQFDTWFSGVKGIFAGDAVGNLTNKVNSMPVFQTAGGSATAISLSDFTLSEGNSKTFIVSANNSGAATTINGFPLYKPNTTAAPTLTKGKAVTVWYDLVKSCFFIKASAEGDATAPNVLAGKAFSNDDDTGIIGTMPNYASSTIGTTGETSVITTIDTFVGNGNATYGTLSHKLKATGYMNGETIVKQNIQGLNPASIKAGHPIGNSSLNLYGTFTSDATAAAADMLSGKTAYVNGAKVTGTIPSKASATITPGTSNQTIAANQYLTGAQTIAGDPDLIASNIVSTANVFGVQGTATVESLGGTFMQMYKTSANYTNSIGSTCIDEAGNVYLLATSGSANCIIYKFDPKMNLLAQVTVARPDTTDSHLRYDRFTNLIYYNGAVANAAGAGWYDTNLNYVGYTYRTNRSLGRYDYTNYTLDEVTGDIYKIARGTNIVITKIDINGNIVYTTSTSGVFSTTNNKIWSIGLTLNKIFIVDSYADSKYMVFNKSDGVKVSQTLWNGYYYYGAVGNGSTNYVFVPRNYSSSGGSTGGFILREDLTSLYLGNGTADGWQAAFSPSGRVVIPMYNGQYDYSVGMIINDGNFPATVPTHYPHVAQVAAQKAWIGASINSNNEIAFVSPSKAVCKIKV